MIKTIREVVVGLRQGNWSIMWLITFFWVMMAVVSSFQTYYLFSLMPSGPSVYQSVYLASLFSLLWALVTPLVFLLARIFPIDRHTVKVHLPIHLFFSILIGISVRLVFLLCNTVMPGIRSMYTLTMEKAMSDIITTFDYQAMVYWVILAIHHGAHYYGKYQAGKLIASQLETQLLQAQLSGLRMQLQPHFLFNTLHAIDALMYESKDRASEMIVRLSEFLRLSLENTGEQEIPLDREIDFIERYLEIERTRFEERLIVEYDVDPKAFNCLVPNLLLQPLVENSIKHGIARIPGGGKLRITANVRNQSLLIFVANNGPSLSSDPSKALEDSLQKRRGIGLANTSARLRALYGAEQSFELRNWIEGGVEACISIPVRFAQADASEEPADLEERFKHEGTYR
jgi:two-component system LytT family sensor kinase